MSTTETETKTIVGVCSEISEKNGWTTFSVEVGSQYPVRLQTKLPAVIEAARGVGQQSATWTYSESQGGENPNKPGTHYVNRRLEKAEVGGAVAPAPTAGGSQVQPAQWTQTKGDVDWDAKERRDYRSRAWAQTLGAFQHTISVNDKPEDVFMRLQPFQRKVFTDVCQSFAFPVTEEDENIPFG